MKVFNFKKFHRRLYSIEFSSRLFRGTVVVGLAGKILANARECAIDHKIKAAFGSVNHRMVRERSVFFQFP